jgi:hypothetical protein
MAKLTVIGFGDIGIDRTIIGVAFTVNGLHVQIQTTKITMCEKESKPPIVAKSSHFTRDIIIDVWIIYYLVDSRLY